MRVRARGFVRIWGHRGQQRAGRTATTKIAAVGFDPLPLTVPPHQFHDGAGALPHALHVNRHHRSHSASLLWSNGFFDPVIEEDEQCRQQDASKQIGIIYLTQVLYQVNNPETD